MTDSNDEKETGSAPDPHMKEQDRGIIEAFAKADHNVLTSSEIAEHVSVSKRTVRRRLDELSEDGKVGKRVTGGVKLAWLEEDIKEPITVRWPLLKFIWNDAGLLTFVVGTALGVISVLLLLAAVLATGNNVQFLFVTPYRLRFIGLGVSLLSALTILASFVAISVEWLLQYFEIESLT